MSSGISKQCLYKRNTKQSNGNYSQFPLCSNRNCGKMNHSIVVFQRRIYNIQKNILFTIISKNEYQIDRIIAFCNIKRSDPLLVGFPRIAHFASPFSDVFHSNPVIPMNHFVLLFSKKRLKNAKNGANSPRAFSANSILDETKGYSFFIFVIGRTPENTFPPAFIFGIK